MTNVSLVLMWPGAFVICHFPLSAVKDWIKSKHSKTQQQPKCQWSEVVSQKCDKVFICWSVEKSCRNTFLHLISYCLWGLQQCFSALTPLKLGLSVIVMCRYKLFMAGFLPKIWQHSATTILLSVLFSSAGQVVWTLCHHKAELKPSSRTCGENVICAILRQ